MKTSEETIPQADKQAHTEIAQRAGRDSKPTSAVDTKHQMSSDEAVPQADKQTHTEIAQQAGQESETGR
jgi:hypothetical protein